MKIKWLKIRNYRIFKDETKIYFNDSKINLFLGNNGTGKSTILQAMMHIFDRKTWIKGFDYFDANINCQGDEINISCKIIVENENDHLNATGLVDKNNEILIDLTSEIINGEYESKIKFNENEDTIIFQGQKNKINNFIDIFYIPETPKGNEFESLLKAFLDENKEDKKIIDSQIKEIIETANSSIKEIEKLDPLSENFKKMIEKFKFNDLSSEIASNLSNISISKSVTFKNKKANEWVLDNGKGYERIVRILALYLRGITISEKESIIIWEEPENNLFFPYQSMAIEWLRTLNRNTQTFISTHSPNVISLNEKDNLIKINKDGISNFMINDDVYYRHQINLHQHLFSDYVLLVEGHSEKIFYEYLSINNECFKEMIKNKNLSIATISGTHFKASKNLLESLGIKVFILTDNDYNEKEKKFTGILRALKLSEYKGDDSAKTLFENKLEFLIGYLNGKNIYIPKQKGDSFEEELMNSKLIDANKKEYLKKSKLKNLSLFMADINKEINKDVIDKSEYLFKWMEKLDD